MVDVGDKAVTTRTARARSKVILPRDVLHALVGSESNQGDGGTITELSGPKGPIFATAVIAGVMAAKKTSELIPFCHPLPIDKCGIDIHVDDEGSIVVESLVRVTHRTGVEMEALTAASVAALCIYDMCKALSHDIVIANTELISKTGGKRDVDKS